MTDHHPAIAAAIHDRVVLREHLRDDAHLVHHVQLLSLFLTALDRTGASSAALARELVSDLLPSDRELIDAAHLRAIAARTASHALWLHTEDDGTEIAAVWGDSVVSVNRGRTNPADHGDQS